MSNPLWKQFEGQERVSYDELRAIERWIYRMRWSGKGKLDTGTMGHAIRLMERLMNEITTLRWEAERVATRVAPTPETRTTGSSEGEQPASEPDHECG